MNHIHTVFQLEERLVSQIKFIPAGTNQILIGIQTDSSNY